MNIAYNSPRKTKSSAPLHVVLYTLIPQDRAYRPIRRSLYLFVRNRMRRLLDLVSWRVFGHWRAHYSSFKDRSDTNRGDISIRMGVRRQIEKAFAGHPLTITELAWGEMDLALRMMPAPDLVVIAGGGYLFIDRDGRLPQRFTDDVRALEQLSCPVAACSIGLNCLIETGGPTAVAFHADSQPDIHKFLARLALGSVRDEYTQRALAAVDEQPLSVIVDPGFLLAEAPQAERAPDPTRPLSVGINLAFHGGRTSVTSERMLPLLLNVCRRLQNEAGCRFTYFVHSDAEIGLAQALRLKGLDLEIINADVDMMLDAYRRMDLHVGQMLHSAILAMSVGTPALSLAYDVKSAGFYSVLGLDELCLDAATVTEQEVFSSVRALIECRHAVAAVLKARRATLEAESDAFYAEVAALASPYRTERLAPLQGSAV